MNNISELQQLKTLFEKQEKSKERMRAEKQNLSFHLEELKLRADESNLERKKAYDYMLVQTKKLFS